MKNSYDKYRINEWVSEYTGIINDQDAMNLFISLNNDVESIRKLITEHIPEKYLHVFALQLIGFFSTIKPKIAQKLIELLKKGDGESFVYVCYQHIFDALEERKKYLKIEDIGTLSNPGKQAADNAIKNVRLLEKLLKPGSVGWNDIPAVPAGFVPTARLTMD